MGCDIHGGLEKKVDGKWVRQEGRNYFEYRNYRCFAILHGVRNMFEPPESLKIITPPDRSFPEDASPEIREASCWDDESWGGGNHSFGWATIKEIIEFPFWETEAKERGETDSFFNFARPLVLDTVQAIRANPDVPLGDLRFVFWFDS